MNAETGFILLYRQIVNWEWYGNLNTFRVFLHCLLKANFTDGRFEGREIKRGQFVTSLDHLSKETKLSVKEIRTALEHLIGTGELASQSFNRYRVITIVKYDEYQSEGKQNGKQRAGKGQAMGNNIIMIIRIIMKTMTIIIGIYLFPQLLMTSGPTVMKGKLG